MNMRPIRFSLFALVLSLTSPFISVSSSEVLDLSLEELLQMKVTTAGKKSQTLSNVAAAVYVISNEDIRRSTATTIPELLRMVPGMSVGRLNNGEWAVSARGDNGVYANQLLVLIDGRSVYTPIFAGVWWDEQDVLLEDIERIEIVLGPGASIWGANAVNGVVNIITKNASETQGGIVAVSGGTEERYASSVRYGGKQEDTSYRMYAKYFNRDNNELTSGESAFDAWQGARTGFRTDTALSDKDTLTFQGDLYYSERGWDFIRPTYSTYSESVDEMRYAGGGNLTTRWSRQLAAESSVDLQMYWSSSHRNDPILRARNDTLDIDFTHRLPVGESHDVQWGLGYRYNEDNLRPAWYNDGAIQLASVTFEPNEQSTSLVTGFVQDEISLSPDTVSLILGSKVEHNDYTGWEVQPTARVVWTPTQSRTFWGAVSRAVRSPARVNNDGRLILAVVPTEVGLPGEITFYGNKDFNSEEVLAYEMGYREQLTERISFDGALFYNRYRHMESDEFTGAPTFVASPAPHIEVPGYIENRIKGDAAGAEISIDTHPTDWWRVALSYSHLFMDYQHSQGSTSTIFFAGQDQSPRNQVYVRSQLNLPCNLEFDSNLRYVDNLPSFPVPRYFELDLRLGWKPAQDWMFEIIGTNLLSQDHLEFVTNFVGAETTDIERGVFGRITKKF